jgi:hypothetical protein
MSDMQGKKQYVGINVVELGSLYVMTEMMEIGMYADMRGQQMMMFV